MIDRRASWEAGPDGTTRARRRPTRRGFVRGALATGAALLPACSAPGGQGTAAAPQAVEKAAVTKAPVTVEYWTFWPAARLEIVQPHLPAFEQRTGYITANLSQVSEFRAKLRTAIVGGTPPDASIGDVFSAALYGDQKVLLQLDPLLKRDGIDLQRDYVLNGFEHWCDRAYAFPLDGFSMALVYNKSMFRERGVPDPWDVQKGQWTWDDFVAALTKLTRDEVVGFHPDNHQLARGYHPFIVANGGEYFDYDTMKYTLDQPQAIDAMEWIHTLAVQRQVMTTQAVFTEMRKATSGEPFAAGWLGVIGDDGAATAAPSVRKLIANRFEWDVVPYPSRRQGEPSYGLVGGNGNWAYGKGRHPDEGYELLKFMGDDAVQSVIGQSGIVPPAQWKARRDQNGFLKPAKHMHVFNDIWTSGYFRTNRAYHYRDLELGPALDKIVQTAFEGTATIKDTMIEANRIGNAQLEYGSKCYRPAWRS
ncbi:MAG: extracellular solute-binding protein [Chloroflexota bacterium]